MIKKLIFLVLFFSNTIYAQIYRVNYDDFKRGYNKNPDYNNPPKKLQNKQFTISDGKLIVIGAYKNGKKDGQFLYYRNGHFQGEENYKKGVKHGYFDEGDASGNYINGIKNGLWRYSNDCIGCGVGSEEITYKKGIQHGYYSNSSEEGFYRNGKKDGEWHYYDMNKLYKYELYSIKAYRKDSLVARLRTPSNPESIRIELIEKDGELIINEIPNKDPYYFDKRSKRQRKRDAENVHKYYNNFIKQPEKAKQASKK